MSEPNLNDILSGGGLGSLLSNPEVAAKLPKIMEALAPIMAEMRDGEANTSEENGEKSTPPLPPPKKANGNANRIALLKAIEPYLSDNRREAMEYIMKVTALIDMLSGVM